MAFGEAALWPSALRLDTATTHVSGQTLDSSGQPRSIRRFSCVTHFSHQEPQTAQHAWHPRLTPFEKSHLELALSSLAKSIVTVTSNGFSSLPTISLQTGGFFLSESYTYIAKILLNARFPVQTPCCLPAKKEAGKWVLFLYQENVQ